MTEQTIAHRIEQERKAARTSKQEVVLDLRGASGSVKRLAQAVHAHEVDNHHDSSAFWFNLAEEILAARYVTPEETSQLVIKYPFLKQYRKVK